MGLFSGVVSAVGGLVGGVLGQSSANSASKAASSAEAAQLDFAKEQYEDWKNVYGPIQDNLSSYYSNLTPDYYAALGLEAFETERTTSMNQLDTYLAQRGLSNSGVAAELKANAGLEAASQRAQIRRSAPAQVAADQMNFLGIGMNANPAPQVANTLSQQAQSARSNANTAAAASGQAWGKAATSVGSLLETGLSSYLGS